MFRGLVKVGEAVVRNYLGLVDSGLVEFLGC